MKLAVGLLTASCAIFSLNGHAADTDKLQTAAGIQQVTVVGSDAQSGIKYKKGDVELQIDWPRVISVEVAEPAELKAARAAYDAAKTDSSKWANVAVAFQPIMDKYPRLPTRWAEDATLALIEASAGAGKAADAQAWLSKFQTWYPRSPRLLTAVAGLAKGLVSAKRYDDAIKLIEEATKTKRDLLAVSEEDGKTLGLALNALGDAYEQKGVLDKALDAYLATKILYYHDPAALKIATEKCEALKPRVAILGR